VLHRRRWTAFSLGRAGDSADSAVLHGRDDIERALDHDFDDEEHKVLQQRAVRERTPGLSCPQIPAGGLSKGI